MCLAFDHHTNDMVILDILGSFKNADDCIRFDSMTDFDTNDDHLSLYYHGDHTCCLIQGQGSSNLSSRSLYLYLWETLI